MNVVDIYSALHTAATLNFAQPDAVKVRLLKVKVLTLDCSSSYAFLIGTTYLVPTLIS